MKKCTEERRSSVGKEKKMSRKERNSKSDDDPAKGLAGFVVWFCYGVEVPLPYFRRVTL